MNTKVFGATTQRKFTHFIAATLLSAMWLTMTGCASFDLSKRIPWGTNDDGIDKPPGRLTAVWTDTVMTQPDKPAMRGFGGRVMFFDGSDEAIKTKGNMVVYAFNEKDRDPSNVTPDKKYVFPAVEFEKHYSKGRLGHSYSFWLPWDDVGGRQTEISLIVKFQPDNGGLITGEQSKHLLPGVVPPEQLSPLREQMRQQMTQQNTTMQFPPPVMQQQPGSQFMPQQNGNQQQMPMPNQQNQMNGQMSQLNAQGQQIMYDNQVVNTAYEQSNGQSGQQLHSVMQNQNSAMNSMIPTNPTMNNGMQSMGTNRNVMDAYEIPLQRGTSLGRSVQQMKEGANKMPSTMQQQNGISQPMQPSFNNNANMMMNQQQMMNNQMPQNMGMNNMSQNVMDQSRFSMPAPMTPANIAPNIPSNNGGTQDRFAQHIAGMRQKAAAARQEQIAEGVYNASVNQNAMGGMQNNFQAMNGQAMLAQYNQTINQNSTNDNQNSSVYSYVPTSPQVRQLPGR